MRPAGPVVGQSALERMPKEVKNVIGSHLDKKSLAGLRATSSTMARTVTPLPAGRAATTVKDAANARMNENKQLRRDWKAMIAGQQATAATHPNRATRFAAARLAIQDKIEDQKFVGELKKELTPLAKVVKKADVQKKKNM